MAGSGELVAQQRHQMAERVKAVTRKESALVERMGISVEVFEREGLNALLHNPWLVDCDQASFERALVSCIQFGLVPDGRDAAIVPFAAKGGKRQATLMPMVQGLMRLARNASPGLRLRARLVFAGDVFDYWEGLEPGLSHVPSVSSERGDANIVACYAVAEFVDGAREFEVMFRCELVAARERSPSSRKAGSPWQTFFGEMCKKTVLKRLLKRLPFLPGSPVGGFEGGGDFNVDAVVRDGAIDPGDWERELEAAEQAHARQLVEVAIKPDPEPEPQPEPEPAPEPEPQPKPKPKPKRNPKPQPESNPQPDVGDDGDPGSDPNDFLF